MITSIGHLVNVVTVTNIGDKPVPVPFPSVCSLTMLYLGVNWLGLYTKVVAQVALALENACVWVPLVGTWVIFTEKVQIPFHTGFS